MGLPCLFRFWHCWEQLPHQPISLPFMVKTSFSQKLQTCSQISKRQYFIRISNLPTIVVNRHNQVIYLVVLQLHRFHTRPSWIRHHLWAKPYDHHRPFFLAITDGHKLLSVNRIPIAMGKPSCVVGCPCNLELSCLNVFEFFQSENTPILPTCIYHAGDICPLEEKKTWLHLCFGGIEPESCYITSK